MPLLGFKPGHFPTSDRKQFFYEDENEMQCL